MPVVPFARRLGVALLLMAAPALAAQPTTFDPLGGPEAGFTWSLLVTDAGDVLAGTRDTYSSAYRSTDGGATWAHLDGLPAGRYEAFTQLASGDLIGASSSDVVRSTDGGETWTSTANGFRFSLLTDLVRDGNDRLYASTYDGVARSTDGGVSWSLANTGLDTLRTSAMAVGPSDEVYVAGLDARLHRSTDGGDSWTPIYEGLPEAYVWSVFVTSAGDVHVGSQRGFYRRPASGTAWEHVTDGLGRDSTNSFYAFAELPSGRLIASAYSATYLSDDGGATWTDPGLSVRPLGPYAMTVAADGTVYAGSFGGGVYRSGDGGDSWTLSTAGLTNSEVRSLGFDLDGRLLVGTAASQTPNGQRWSPTTETWSGLGMNTNRVSAWLRTSGNVLLAGTSRGVYRSTDRGSTWTLSAVVNREVYALAEAPGDTLYAGTFDQGIARSTDGGTTWTFLDSPLGRTTHLAVAPDGTVYAGITVFGASDIEAGLIRSTDGGTTWTYINGWGTTPRNPSALAVDPEGRLLASFGLREAYRSSDRGDTWAEVVGLTPYTQVFHASGGDVLAGQRDGTLFRTSDGGATWDAVVSEPTGLSIRAVAVADEGTIYLGTWGRGVFRSASGGSTAAEDDLMPRGGLALRAYPSPFPAATTVEVALPEAAPLRLDVFDTLGRQVAALDEGARADGTHRVRLDGAGWPAGLYIVRVTAGDLVEAVRIVKAR